LSLTINSLKLDAWSCSAQTAPLVANGSPDMVEVGEAAVVAGIAVMRRCVYLMGVSFK
jgi:hypothetical protein